MHQTEKASCCGDLPQAQCDLVAELWSQLRTSLVFMCENRTPLPKYKTSGHMLSSTPAVMFIQGEPNPRNSNSPALCVSPGCKHTCKHNRAHMQEICARSSECPDATRVSVRTPWCCLAPGGQPQPWLALCSVLGLL